LCQCDPSPKSALNVEELRNIAKSEPHEGEHYDFPPDVEIFPEAIQQHDGHYKQDGLKELQENEEVHADCYPSVKMSHFLIMGQILVTRVRVRK
jgi:hypothetical protein